MQADPRSHMSLPLAHDHFRAGTSRAPDSKTPLVQPDRAKPGPIKSTAADRPGREPGQKMRALADVARRAAKTGLETGRQVTTRTIAAARWSGEQTSRLATRLKSRVSRPASEPASAADRFAEQSLYTRVPNRLAALAALSEEQHALVRASLPGRRTHQAGSTMLAEGEQTPHPTFILSGWAARTRVQNGKLHVLGVLLPGDGVCLFGPPCAVATTTLIALTTVETANAAPLMDIIQEADGQSPVRLAMHRAMAEDEAFLLNQTMRLMMKPATARLAHLLLELHYRLTRVGLATDSEMPFALDRRILAAALGLSPRAVGGVVRALEQRKIARFGHNRLVILRQDELRKLAGFAPPAFAEGSGRRVISDVGASDITIAHGPWMDAATRRSPAPAARTSS